MAAASKASFAASDATRNFIICRLASSSVSHLPIFCGGKVLGTHPFLRSNASLDDIGVKDSAFIEVHVIGGILISVTCENATEFCCRNVDSGVRVQRMRTAICLLIVVVATRLLVQNVGDVESNTINFVPRRVNDSSPLRFIPVVSGTIAAGAAVKRN